MARYRTHLGACIFAGAVFFACQSKGPSAPDAGEVGVDVHVDSQPAATAEHKDLPGDPVRGHALVDAHECNRCHAVEGVVAAGPAKHCVSCHADIVAGKFEAHDFPTTGAWKKSVAEFTKVPSLVQIGKRLEARAIVDYLVAPVHLRPALAAYMPRLGLTRDEARDIAAYLGATECVAPAECTAPTDSSLRVIGRGLAEAQYCGVCHLRGGARFGTSSELPKEWHATAAQLATGKRLAPDLAFVAGRYSFAGLVNWLKNPRALQPGTAMITPPMPEEQARAIATYLLTEPVVRPRPQLPARLPPLTRKVSFAEVDAKVFHRTCWHCHAEPDYSIGDGGPGNSGGFGFRPRGLNLASYEGIAAGVTDEHGQRVSVFLPAPGSDTPRLLESLLARHREEAVGGSGAVRGMPLGYAPLSPEEIQLVETWIVQGRPR